MANKALYDQNMRMLKVFGDEITAFVSLLHRDALALSKDQPQVNWAEYGDKLFKAMNTASAASAMQDRELRKRNG